MTWGSLFFRDLEKIDQGLIFYRSFRGSLFFNGSQYFIEKGVPFSIE